MPTTCETFLIDDSASSAIEYALVAGLFGLAIVYPLSVAGARIAGLVTFVSWALTASAQ